MHISLVAKEIVLVRDGTTSSFGNHDYDNRSIESRKYSREEFIGKLSTQLFVELNGFWQTKSAEWRSELFDVYITYLERIKDSATPSERNVALSEAVKLLVDKYHPYEEIREYMKGCQIDTSDKVKDVYDDKLDMMSRMTTYIRSEYEELATMTIVLRSVYPLWNISQKLSTSSSLIGGDVTIEMELFNTLHGTDFTLTPPFQRLQDYVDALWEKFNAATSKSSHNAKNSILSSVVAGIGTSDIPNYLMATSVVKRLAQREINTFRDNGDLITCVFRRIDNELKSMGTKFANIRPKKFKSEGDDADKTGYLETFRSRERIRRDLAITATVYFKNPRKVIKSIDDSVPPDLLRSCLASFRQYKPDVIPAEIVPYIQYVCGLVVQPRAVMQLNRETFINAMAVTQAVLIHWKLHGIAQLISSTPKDFKFIDGTIFDDVPVALKKELAEIYPCHRYARGSSSKNPRCPGNTAVEAIADNLTGKRWVLHCSDKIGNILNLRPGEHRAPRNLKILTAELLIRIEKRKRGMTTSDVAAHGKSVFMTIAEAVTSEEKNKTVDLSMNNL